MTALLHENTTAGTGNLSDDFVVFRGPDAFQAIHQPSCAASIWQRTLLLQFQNWIEKLEPACLPSGRLILQPGAVASAFDQLCEIAKMPVSDEREMFINDVHTLAELFCDSMKSPYLRLRLDKITGNACSKFHKDAITARLVCTYRGTGTQYCHANINESPRDIKTVPTGSPIIMRGTRWPETPASQFLHRSPPIEGKGETRLVLVIDAITDPENEI